MPDEPDIFNSNLFGGVDEVQKECINWILLSYLAMGLFEKLFNWRLVEFAEGL